MKVPSFVTDPDPQLYEHGSYVVLDFETTNINFGSALVPENRLLLACWSIITPHSDGTCTTQHKYRWGSEYDMQELVLDIQDVDFLVAQNAKFELQWLERCGYDIGSRPVYDTLVAEWVLAGGRRWTFDLDSIAKRYKVGGKESIVSKLIKGGVPTEDIPRSMLLRYCIRDVEVTHAVMRKQLEKMRGTRLLAITYTRCLTTIVLADIEGNGMHLDAGRVEAEYEKTLQEFVQVEREMEELTGGINPNSPKQVADYLYETLGFDEVLSRWGKPLRTSTDKPKTDADTIQALNATTPEQIEFLDLKQRQGKLHAALTKNLEFFIGACREQGGTFLGQINQARTVTHRLASSGVPTKFKAYPKPKSCQFQNLPRQFKNLFAARKEGWYVAEADGAQLEFRVAGHLGKDEQIEYEILNDVDIHAFTALTLTEAGEPTDRQGAKESTFRPLYGGSSGSPAVEAYCKAFVEKYHQLNSTQRGWVLEAADRGYIETEWGMRYYFPYLKTTKSGYIQGQQSVYNYPVQALATAEIIPIALVFFWYRTREADLFIVNTVHDSIICEVPEKEIELFSITVVQALTEDVYGYLDKVYGMRFTIPLGVGTKIGHHWNEADEDVATRVHEALKDIGSGLKIDKGEVGLDIPPPPRT